jgi:ABC-type multidrug transport system fused ATPase/permease subunit
MQRTAGLAAYRRPGCVRTAGGGRRAAWPPQGLLYRPPSKRTALLLCVPQEAGDELSGLANELLEASPVVKVFRAQRRQLARFDALSSRWRALTERAARAAAAMDALSRARSTLCVAASLGMGAELCRQGAITLGTCYAVFVYAFSFAFAMGALPCRPPCCPYPWCLAAVLPCCLDALHLAALLPGCRPGCPACTSGRARCFEPAAASPPRHPPARGSPSPGQPLQGSPPGNLLTWRAAGNLTAVSADLARAAGAVERVRRILAQCEEQEALPQASGRRLEHVRACKLGVKERGTGLLGRAACARGGLAAAGRRAAACPPPWRACQPPSDPPPPPRMFSPLFLAAAGGRAL